MKNALILSGIYWNETWQRHQQFAEYLASMDYKVYFVEHIVSSVLTVKKVKEMLMGAESINFSCDNPKNKNIILCSIKTIPPQNVLFDVWNKHQVKILLKKINVDFDVVINYLPINTTRFFLENIQYQILVYDCVRNFAGWTGCKYPKAISKDEKELADCSDMIFTDSFYLTDKFCRMGYGNKVMQFLPVINNEWNRGVVDRTVPQTINRIAYFGTLSMIHNNIEVYRMLAEAGIEIHFWGSIPSELGFPYVNHGFRNNLAELSREITEMCDAIVIAYRGNMDGVIPAKLFQALGSNLPVFISSFYDADKLSEQMYVFQDESDLLRQISCFSPDDYAIKRSRNRVFLKDKGEVTQYEQFKSCILLQKKI